MTVTRFAMRGSVVLGVVALLTVAAGLGYRALVQRDAERALSIRTPAGIDEARFVQVGETQQWVWMRGQDRSNPLLLIVHGGPGTPTSAVAQQLLTYERDYVLVHWDQPGAGRTFGRNGLDPTLGIDRVARDGVAVAEHVQAYLHNPRMILLGVSWGSVVGIRMARLRPELFGAYVGTGQIVNMRRGEELAYRSVLEELQRRGDAAAIEELEAIGPPPYALQRELGVQRKWASRLEGTGDPRIRLLGNLLVAPRYSLQDALAYLRGFAASQDHFFGAQMDGPLLDVNLAADATSFELPIFLLQGTDDRSTPAVLPHEYLQQITAPHKELVPFAGAGHLVLVTHAEAFVAALNGRVRPLTLRLVSERRAETP